MRAHIMTSALLAVLLLPFGGQAHAQECAVSVSIANVQAVEGAILGALYDEQGWGGESLANARASVTDGAPRLCFEAPPGRYGVRLFHDRDGDGRLAANLVGIPTEPFGFSNDAPVQFGPPSFEAAAFDLGEDGSAITITLR